MPVWPHLGHWPIIFRAAIHFGSVFRMASGGNGERQSSADWDRVIRRKCTMKTVVTRRQTLAAASALALGRFVAKAGALEKVGMQLILAADVSGA